MPFEKRDLSGALFKNDKRGNDKAPDYTGDSLIEGREFRVSAWIKKSQAGTTFMSLAYTPKDAVRTPTPAPTRRVGGMSDAALDDDMGGDRIPF